MGRKRKTERYFKEEQERAVFLYNISDSQDERSEIYVKYLQKPLDKMIQSILRKYSFTLGNYDMDELEANALSHLIENMYKYKPWVIKHRLVGTKNWKTNQNNKFYYEYEMIARLEYLTSLKDDNEYYGAYAPAFSYLQTIVKNYFIDHSKRSYSHKTTDLNYEDFTNEIDNKKEYHYEINVNELSDMENLIYVIIDKINERIEYDKSLKKNEIIVGEAIANVLENWHILFLEESPVGKYEKRISNKYQKNKVLELLKEQTRLNTKDLRNGIKPFKMLYFLEKEIFLEEE